MFASSLTVYACVVVVVTAQNTWSSLPKNLSTGASQSHKTAYIPWFHDAYSYWDFDKIENGTVQDLNRPRRSRVVGQYKLIPGPKDNALELSKSLSYSSSYVILGDFPDTCLPNPGDCHQGFTIAFWVNLQNVSRDGVILQLGLTRKSRGITVKTYTKHGAVSLAFYVNTRTIIHYLEAKLSSKIWHHVAIVWTAEQKMSVLVNCSVISHRKRSSKPNTSRKGADRTMFLGANHAGKKASTVAVDDFAIWLKDIEQARICRVINEQRVHGNYSSWSAFSPCSLSCGSGTRTRNRSCDNPTPDYGGRDCFSLGPPSETEQCNETPCPIAGGYTQWSNFSHCSSSCGGGKRYRTRNCTHPTPQYGGANCSRLGVPVETQDCNTNGCPVHGNYSSWTVFSPCSTSCGDGFHTRHRFCTNPEPKFGGRNCSWLGSGNETGSCNLGVCPVHGGYSEWSVFTHCTKSCGNATRTRTRTCTSPKPSNGGRNCSILGTSINTVACDNLPCPVHGGYSEWSVFTRCTKSCGNATRTRTRTCTSPKPSNGGRNCSILGTSIDTVACDNLPCPVHGGYSEWSVFTHCTKSCGNATRTRTRTCTSPKPSNGGRNCSILGTNINIVPCDNSPCPVHGNYTEWSNFTLCDKTCGNGSKFRRRYCGNPEPRYGGRNCSMLGHDTERVLCKQSPCPVHGNFSQWSDFSECTSTCGNSTRSRTRNCSNPLPLHGGNDCSSLGPHIQVVKCDVLPCPVNGNYSDWSLFTPCSKTCGNGSQMRNRTCTNPTPLFGGKNCTSLGPGFEIRQCFTRPCPIHGNYSEWSLFTGCSKTCGNGSQIWRRACTNPRPYFGGKNCRSLGPSFEIRRCFTRPCPIHGNYSEWSTFSECTSTCGNSTKRRTRDCTNPTPMHDGNDCSSLGPRVQVVKCDVLPCPVNGNYSEWSLFTPCGKTCGNGSQIRNRTCTNPTPHFGGKDCQALGLSTETRLCFLRRCPIHGNYSDWSTFSECTSTCGNSTKRRTRNCTNPSPMHDGNDCSSLGSRVQVVKCDVLPCPVHGNYSEWSLFTPCSKTCGNGSRIRNRNCTNPKPLFGGKNCTSLGPNTEARPCYLRRCPIHGNYSEWSLFTGCSKTCGNGSQIWRRACTNPTPYFGGENCRSLGPSFEIRRCFTRPCPIHGNYSEWSTFSECTSTCGNSTKRRTRDCTNPTPMHDGNDCSSLGSRVQVVRCDVPPCPVNGNYSEWSLFTPCSKTCGNGSQIRNRTCTNPTPQFGGKDCQAVGLSTETRLCFLRRCPIHGNYSDWSTFSECTSTCGNSTKRRTRNCTNPSPMHDGNDCSSLGSRVQVVKCDVLPCPVHGNYSEWSLFTPCSKTCGNGSRIRNRNCTNPKPLFGAKNCTSLGPNTEARPCYLPRCPIHGNYSEWSLFTGCSKTCGNGSQVWRRACTNPRPYFGGKNCRSLGPSFEIRRCFKRPCPIHGNYSEWSSFSECTSTCGNSTKRRTRDCTNPTPMHDGNDCSSLGPRVQVVKCGVPPCPVNGNYSEWSLFIPCSKTCGNASQIRNRTCTNPTPRFGGKDCEAFGRSTETRPCFLRRCPIHGNYSEWSKFSECSTACGNSTKRRTRNCTNPTPIHDGNDCSSLGPRVQVVKCDLPPCPVDGNYSKWSLFTPCSKTCGNGSQIRNRTCTNPTPRFGGRNCSTIGPSTETGRCFARPCPIHGNFTQWSEFTNCTATCGPGTKTRRKSCSNPSPRFGGDDCSKLGPSNQTVYCSLRPCPVHGNYSEWPSFGVCSKSCDSGTQVRRRYCNNPSPRFGGRSCSAFGSSVETRHCETQPCPDIDFIVKFKLNDEQWDDELLNKSSKRYQKLSHDLKTAIRELHESGIVKDVKIMAIRSAEEQSTLITSARSKGSVVASVEVIYLTRYFPGPGNLYDALHTDRRIGFFNVTPISFTSSDVPIGFPPNFTPFNRSSTSLGLRWSPVPDHLANGVIWGYTVTYEELLAGKGETKRIYKTIFVNTTTGSLNQLKKYSWYKVKIAPMNRRGLGIASAFIEVLTDEDVPNSSPNLKPFGFNTSSTSLNVSWKAISKADVNGILRGYCIFYKASINGVIYNRTVSQDTLSVVLSGLEKYMGYEIRIAGVTSKGVGRKSNKTAIYTDEDVPDAAPVFHSCSNDSSTSIQLQWYDIPKNKQVGIILSFNVYHREAVPSNQTWIEIKNISAVQRTLRISELKMYTNYLFRISAFTKKGEGRPSQYITVSTDEDVPCDPPSEVTAIAATSSSLWVEWRSLSPDCIRGILRGYAVFYRRKRDSNMAYRKITVPPTNTKLILTKLQKFTSYDVSLAGYTSKGLGPRSPFIRIRTEEDVPSKSPVSLQAFNTSSTSIQLKWRPIPRAFLHGVLRGYHVLLRKASESHTEKKFTVEAIEESYDIFNLIKYTKYVVRIVGFTSMGVGVASREVLVSTDEDVPSHTPEKFMAVNKSGPTSIPLSWKPIKDSFYVHGVLLGYKIEYELTGLAGEPSTYAGIRTIHTVGPKILSLVLTDLEIYATYRIRIWAFTRIGDGTSAELYAETCNCRSFYRTNWWINPPYMDKNSTDFIGIFSAILPPMVAKCCGFCHEHVSTVTRFEKEHNQDPSSSFLKPGVSVFRDHIDDNTELHFPMYGQIYQVKYYKRYEFIPLVESPGVVFLVLKDDTHRASMLLYETLQSTLPILLLMAVLIWIFAVLLWFADNLSNSNQFPSSFIPGVYHGMWWSLITMTTIGYGDRIPRSAAGRLVGIIWILMGAVIMSLYTSVITSNITTEIVVTGVKLYGTKVAVIHNSSEHRLAVRKNAKPDLGRPYNNLYDIYDALSKHVVEGALVDAYVLGSRKDLFNSIGIRINKIYDYSSAYGVVVTGEAKKLQKCMREHVKENRKRIFQIIEENVDMIEEDSLSQSVKRAKTLVDPTFIVYKKCLFTSIILLFIAIILGILFEFARKLRLQKWLCHSRPTSDAEKQKNRVTSVQKSLQFEVQELMRELTGKLDNLKHKHRKELKQWVKLKKSLQKQSRFNGDSWINLTSVSRYDEVQASPVLPLRKLMESNAEALETETMV